MYINNTSFVFASIIMKIFQIHNRRAIILSFLLVYLQLQQFAKKVIDIVLDNYILLYDDFVKD